MEIISAPAGIYKAFEELIHVASMLTHNLRMPLNTYAKGIVYGLKSLYYAVRCRCGDSKSISNGFNTLVVIAVYPEFASKKLSDKRIWLSLDDVADVAAIGLLLMLDNIRLKFMYILIETSSERNIYELYAAADAKVGLPFFDNKPCQRKLEVVKANAVFTVKLCGLFIKKARRNVDASSKKKAVAHIGVLL